MGIALGTYLKNAREYSGRSQGTVAKELGFTSPQFISNVERGISRPTRGDVSKWCKAFKANKRKVYNIWVKEFKDELHRELGLG